MRNVTDFSQEIIGYSRGVPIFQMIGAEEVSDPSGQSATGSITPQSGQSAATGSNTAGEGQSTPDLVSREDYERLRLQLSAADQKRAEAEQARKALEDRDKSELDRTKSRAEELEQSVQGLQSTLRQLQLENSFLKDRTYNWHDPGDVLKFVSDNENVSIGDDGKVIGMEAALKDIATKKPYLVKADEPKAPSTPSGDPSNGSGDKGKGLNEEVLRRKYPALKR